MKLCLKHDEVLKLSEGDISSRKNGIIHFYPELLGSFGKSAMGGPAAVATGTWEEVGSRSWSQSSLCDSKFPSNDSTSSPRGVFVFLPTMTLAFQYIRAYRLHKFLTVRLQSTSNSIFFYWKWWLKEKNRACQMDQYMKCMETKRSGNPSGE